MYVRFTPELVVKVNEELLYPLCTDFPSEHARLAVEFEARFRSGTLAAEVKVNRDSKAVSTSPCIFENGHDMCQVRMLVQGKGQEERALGIQSCNGRALRKSTYK